MVVGGNGRGTAGGRDVIGAPVVVDCCRSIVSGGGWIICPPPKAQSPTEIKHIN